MAIKVNGTTVIDDSRNLTNITSVDSTTVTALSNAGVGGGGGWELLQNTDITSDISYIEYNFPTGYSEFRFILNRMKTVQTGQYQYDTLVARLKNSSGTLMTSTEEYFYLTSNNTQMTAYSYWSGMGVIGNSNSSAYNDPAQTMVIDVIAPRRSDINTTFRSQAVGYWANGPNRERDSYIAAGTVHTTQDNTGIRFFGQQYNIDATSDEWLVYGVPDA